MGSWSRTAPGSLAEPASCSFLLSTIISIATGPPPLLVVGAVIAAVCVIDAIADSIRLQ
jgi:hypothetical protein